MRFTYLLAFSLTLLLTGKISLAQNFTDMNAQLPGLESGSAAWADYDNDGDLDLAMTGFSSLVAERSFIYRNDNGIMTAVDSSIIKVANGSVNWADFDNDGDPDLMLNGQNNGSLYCELYRNDNQTFVAMNPGFVRVLGIQRWLDVDNDGFQDVVISGVMDSLWVDTTIIYRNNGNSTFTYFPSNLPPLTTTGMDVADCNNDSLPDIFIIATAPGGLPVAALFTNNGNGNFTMDTTSFMQIFAGAVKWGDAENDGDMDLLYDGILIDNSAYTLIYLNDGAGNFTNQSTNLPGTGEPGSVDWADIDNDNDLDVLLSEYLFRNDGNGTFTNISPWPAFSYYAIPAMFTDYDTDGDADIFMLMYFGISNSNIFRNELLTDVDDIPEVVNISVYPNPTDHLLNILSDLKEVQLYELYSIEGRFIQILKVINSSQLDLSEIPQGIYFLGIKNNEKREMTRIVIE